MTSNKQSQVKKPQIAQRTPEREAMRIIEESNNVLEALSNDATSDRRQYPESEFRRNFLPVINGAALKNPPKGMTAEDVKKSAMACWLLVAGSYVGEVDVVNSDGTVAFTMPAISDSSVLSTIQKTGDENMSSIEEEFRESHAGMGRIAETNLINSLNQHLLKNTNEIGPDEKEARRKIEVMRKFYGLTSEKEEVTNPHSNSDFMGTMSF